MIEMTNTRDGEEFWVTTRAGETVELVRRSLYDEVRRTLARREVELGRYRAMHVLAVELARAWDAWDGNPDHLAPLGQAHKNLFTYLDTIGQPWDTAAKARMKALLADAVGWYERLAELVTAYRAALAAESETTERLANSGLLSNDIFDHPDTEAAEAAVERTVEAMWAHLDMGQPPDGVAVGDGVLAADLDLLDGAGTDPADAVRLIRSQWQPGDRHAWDDSTMPARCAVCGAKESAPHDLTCPGPKDGDL